MQNEVIAVNRACLQAAYKLSRCDEKWKVCMRREFGMSEQDVTKIESLSREKVRAKATNPTVLYKVRHDRMKQAVDGLSRGSDYYCCESSLSQEAGMAISVFVGNLRKCLEDDLNEACVRFHLSPEMASELLKHGSDEIIEAMIANQVTFEPSRAFRAMFTAENNLERTRFMLQDMTNFLCSNNVLPAA